MLSLKVREIKVLAYLLVPQYPLPLSTLGSIILGAELPNANSMLLLLFFL